MASEKPSISAPLTEWLTWLETIHPVSVDMGLERVSRVADKLALRPVSNPLVLIGGTNGKGSTVAMLSSIYTAAGYRVGAYCSPHIHDFRERICVNGRMVSEQDIVHALDFVESGRAPETLTYFEYTTLAAMRVFQLAHCDVILLEVGLGGRLDATNIWDADCSVITSIALDHEDYLGSDINVIATEKAAIGRPDKILVVGETNPPLSMFHYAAEQHISIEHVGGWPTDTLPYTALTGAHQNRNAGCAVAVVEVLIHQLPVNADTISQALMSASLPGRFECLEVQGVSVVLDVAHNPAGADALREAWQGRYPGKRAQVIFACLDDKDLVGIVDALQPIVEHWHCIELNLPRSTAGDALVSQVRSRVLEPVSLYNYVDAAWQNALSLARENAQPVLVAGSFHTIDAVHSALQPKPLG